ncbi:MAG: bifunctional riboflavin kinase/FAD synthetase [Acidobacteriota bacterium]
MRTVKNFSEIPDFKKKTAVAIGNFDGIHVGHKKILEYLVKTAKKNNLTSVVLTFSPHPEAFFKKGKFFLIQPLEEKLAMISSFHVDVAVVIPFDKTFSMLSPAQFIENILINSLNSQFIVVGQNFKFGKNRKGDVSLLQKIAGKQHISLHLIPQVSLDGEIVSSSKIRHLLRQGEIEKANQFLDHPYKITGKVMKGFSRGRNLGFPTANLNPDNDIIPSGVFITKSLLGSKKFPSVTNIGHCPTFNKNKRDVESYIMNLKTDLYGKKMGILLLKKIREEKKFDSPEELQKQIQKDISITKQYFKMS